jgi:hypothetical protein
MAKKIVSTVTGALPQLVAGVARDVRVAAAGRADLGNLLGADDLKRAADTDPSLAAELGRVGKTLAEDDKAAAAWQQALAEATKKWEVNLTEFAELHPDS